MVASRLDVEVDIGGVGCARDADNRRAFGIEVIRSAIDQVTIEAACSAEVTQISAF